MEKPSDFGLRARSEQHVCGVLDYSIESARTSLDDLCYFVLCAMMFEHALCEQHLANVVFVHDGPVTLCCLSQRDAGVRVVGGGIATSQPAACRGWSARGAPARTQRAPWDLRGVIHTGFFHA